MHVCTTYMCVVGWHSVIAGLAT